MDVSCSVRRRILFSDPCLVVELAVSYARPTCFESGELTAAVSFVLR